MRRMSSQYDSLFPADAYPEFFGVAAPATPIGRAVWPRQQGVFLRRVPTTEVLAPVAPPEADAPDAADPSAAPAAPEAAPFAMELVGGQFGLVPPWVKSASDAKLRSTKLVNLRSEGVTTSNNVRNAWLKGQRCIVPMMAFQEDDMRSGKAVPTRIARVDGKPMGAAGVWECWTGADGQQIVSFGLLTINANSHALMHRYQQPGAEKRMPVILNEGAYSAWLSTRPEKAGEFLRAFAAQLLHANPIQGKGKSAT
jgi:putative SOS response-associated peptidase YedK